MPSCYPNAKLTHSSSFLKSPEPDSLFLFVSPETKHFPGNGWFHTNITETQTPESVGGGEKAGKFWNQGFKKAGWRVGWTFPTIN
ncbi:hypothetical protein CDAR_461911 [Caerostris darwini]|uniref:Uncharacterized protein n=1 Tax=Caerostris darwini TaxID=1538125 RepID=A0AAV4TBH7_9ARAC|nr:hypothetical protein CDAR_461911 [Caerostris darwini]